MIQAVFKVVIWSQGFRVGKSVSEPFKKRFSIPYSSMELQVIISISFQRQIIWEQMVCVGFIDLVPDVKHILLVS